MELLYALVASPKPQHLPSKMPLITLRHFQQFNPWILSYVLLYDVIGAVRRAITDDNPLKRPHGLCHNRLNSKFNKLGFVSGRSNKDVGR